MRVDKVHCPIIDLMFKSKDANGIVFNLVPNDIYINLGSPSPMEAAARSMMSTSGATRVGKKKTPSSNTSNNHTTDGERAPSTDMKKTPDGGGTSSSIKSNKPGSCLKSGNNNSTGGLSKPGSRSECGEIAWGNNVKGGNSKNTKDSSGDTNMLDGGEDEGDAGEWAKGGKKNARLILVVEAARRKRQRIIKTLCLPNSTSPFPLPNQKPRYYDTRRTLFLTS